MNARNGQFKSAVATDLVFTYGKQTHNAYRICGFHFSYSDDPSGGILRIEILDPAESSTYRTLIEYAITKGGPGPIEFLTPIETEKNSGVRVTLTSGGGSITGRLTSFVDLIGKQ